MPPIRTFIALETPHAAQEYCGHCIRTLQDKLPPAKSSPVRWVHSSNIHLTLRFLGDTDPTRIKSISSALDTALQPFNKFSITLETLGFFPGDKNPRVLWVGIKAPPLLANLQQSVENSMQTVGFAPENKAFAAHLTLARVQRNASKEQLEPISGLKNVPLPPCDSVMIDTITLFQSKLSKIGSVYIPLHAVKLD